MNYSQVTPQIWVGSAIENLQDAIQVIRGITPTRIINCRAEFDEEFLLDQVGYNGMYLWDGVPDWTPEAALGLQPLPGWFFKAGLDFWLPFRQGPGERIYVHCWGGINRSVILTYAILIAQGMCRFDALATLNRARAVTILTDFIDNPWREDAERAVAQLGYVVR